MTFYKKRKAQHIVEFTLFMPFLIIFIGVITEISFSMSMYYRFTASVYQAINSVAMTSKLNNTREEITEAIRNSARRSLIENRAPFADTINIDIIETGDLDIVVASYEYRTAFTLVNAIFSVTPDEYRYSTIIPVNSAILKGNTYNIDEENLNTAFTNFYINTAPPPAPGG